MVYLTECYTGRAADYDRYRERYEPEVLLPRLRTWCGLTPEWIVADIGAGTGMLADVFLANGNHVLAVEPNAEMRERCATLHANDPRLEATDGTAEASTLPAHSIDLVCMGRAFHWFEIDSAINEFRRILRPKGWLMSVVCGRAGEGSEANFDVEMLVRSFTTNGGGAGAARAKYARLPEFLVRDYRHEELEGTMQVTEAELLGLLRSGSHMPLPGDPRFRDLERGTSDLFAVHAVDGHITLMTRYLIDVGRF